MFKKIIQPKRELF